MSATCRQKEVAARIGETGNARGRNVKEVMKEVMKEWDMDSGMQVETEQFPG